jgi:hypothetical protein
VPEKIIPELCTCFGENNCGGADLGADVLSAISADSGTTSTSMLLRN